MATMATKWIGVWLGVLLFSMTSFAQEQDRSVGCRPLAPAAVDAWLQTKRKLVFFASWCGSCKEHLQLARTEPDTGLVLVFDQVDQGNGVLRALGLKNECVTSPELVRRFGVEALPRAVLLVHQ
jgi:hypothetical protein